MFGKDKISITATAKGPSVIGELTKTCIAWTEFEHRLQLAEATNRREYSGGITKEIAAALRERNLVWFLPRSEIVGRFYYAASVRFPTRDSPVREGVGVALLYVGDIPEFALRNMKAASECGLDYFTIHSTLPMPVALGGCDPLLMGWVMNPLFFMNPVFRETVPEILLGVVIAIWGQDGEELKV